MEMIIWIVLIIVFTGIEMATVGLASLWFTGGAVVALLVQLAGLNIYWQIISFILVSAVLLMFVRPWAVKYLKPHLVKTNYETIIGEDVCLTETIDNVKGTGTAVYKGQEWTARAYENGKIFEAGMIVAVKEIRGVTLYVTESRNMPKTDKKMESYIG